MIRSAKFIFFIRIKDIVCIKLYDSYFILFFLFYVMFIYPIVDFLFLEFHDDKCMYVKELYDKANSRKS